MGRKQKTTQDVVGVNNLEEMILDNMESLDNTHYDTINCLKNEKVIVRLIPRKNGINISNSKHVAYGGMYEGSIKSFCVPIDSKGSLVQVLTKDEQDCLEEIMGLEHNALSIHRTEKNYWYDKYVELQKHDNYFDLSDPKQYIDYKILLANKDFIASSLREYEDHPYATYMFVVIGEGEEEKKNNANISATMQCYKEFGKVEDDINVLRTIVETIDGKPTAKGTNISFYKNRINELIQADSKFFLKIIQDPLLSTKVLLKMAVEAGALARRDNKYYLIEGNKLTPLCENNEEPTFNNAAKYVASAKRSELKFLLESKVK